VIYKSKEVPTSSCGEVPRIGVQVTFLANSAKELYDKELNLILPIIILNKDFTDLLNNKVL